MSGCGKESCPVCRHAKLQDETRRSLQNDPSPYGCLAWILLCAALSAILRWYAHYAF